MSWASSIVAGPCRREVIKSAYPPGRELINSTFSPRRGAEAHMNSLNPSLASFLSLRMSAFLSFFFLLFLFLSFFFLNLDFKEKMKIISTKLEFELTVLCVRDLFIMIWYCSGQHARYAGDHPVIPSTSAPFTIWTNQQQVEGLGGVDCALLWERVLLRADPALGCSRIHVVAQCLSSSIINCCCPRDVAGGSSSCGEFCAGP